MTKQFLCCLSFEKPLIDFHFDENLYTQSVTQVNM